MFDKGQFIDKISIFGDDEMIEEWCNDHPHPNCGEPDWKCFVAISEYDYLFVNTTPLSPHFSGARHVVYNCFEDNHLTSDFEMFFERVEGLLEGLVACKTGCGVDEEDECDLHGSLFHKVLLKAKE